MKIYGVALLAVCYLTGKILGQYLGIILGIGGNVGGVGIAMFLLILINERVKDSRPFMDENRQGIHFWSSMYIPVVIAMSSVLNVKAALSGGWVAVFAGIIATSACYLLIPSISKLSGRTNGSN